MEMTEKARNKYTEMRRDVEKEIQERLREKLENVEQSHFEQGMFQDISLLFTTLL